MPSNPKDQDQTAEPREENDHYEPAALAEPDDADEDARLKRIEAAEDNESRREILLGQIAVARAALYEAEEAGDAAKAAGFSGGDRTRIELPDIQGELLRALHATGKPVVYVQMSGSAIATPWEAEHLAAIVQAWYPGERGGEAVADVVTGAYNPAGRLPVTFYASTAQLPPFTDYALTNRTYRYLRERPLYAFGHGLSYTEFAYRDLRIHANADGVDVSCEVANVGRLPGDEVVQCYVTRPGRDARTPIRQLAAFARVHLEPGERRTIALQAPAPAFAVWDTKRDTFVTARGWHHVHVGTASDDIRLSGGFHGFAPV